MLRNLGDKMEPEITSDSTDFAILPGSDVYALYFNLLLDAFGKLLTAQAAEAAHGNYEAEVTKGFLEKLLFTVRALRLKFLYSPVHNLEVDMSNSGFPNRDVIASLENDLRLRDDRLQKLQPESLLKMRILDCLIQKGEEPSDLLWQLADRAYFDIIEEEKLFFPFTPGELIKRKKSKDAGDVRSYTYSWACYDFSTSRPYFHIMSFDQDSYLEPLEKDDASLLQFLHVIKAEGRRAPNISVLATAIDSAINWLHPKSIKRVCLGPLYSPLLIGNRTCFTDEIEAAACSLLASCGKRPQDFFLFFTHEMVFSERQVERGSFFGKRVREIYHIPTDDPAAFSNGASSVFRSVLMPHVVRQNIKTEEANAFELNTLKVLTYDEEGKIYGA